MIPRPIDNAENHIVLFIQGSSTQKRYYTDDGDDLDSTAAKMHFKRNQRILDREI